MFVSATPIIFFTYQLAIAIIEFTGLWFFVNRLMPKKTDEVIVDKAAIRKILIFTLTIAFTSAVWVIITQTDKLILSKLLKLSEFGYYSLAVQVAGGVTLLAGPIGAAILPRLTKLEAEGDHRGLLNIYSNATQFVVIAGGTVSLILIFFAKQVLYVWTGNLILTNKVAPYLILYTVGNFLLSIAAFPYYLQFAKGNLKFHLYGNIGFVIVLIPTLVIVVNNFGGLGAGYVWIGVNALYLFIWIPFIHNHFVKGLNAKWYVEDILKIIYPPLIISILFFYCLPPTSNRLYACFQLCSIAASIMIAFIITSKKLRQVIVNFKSK